MSLIFFPTALPGVKSFSFRPSGQVVGAPDSAGDPKDFNRITQVPGATATVAWQFIEGDFAIFRNFWTTELLNGHRWFWIELPSAGGITWHCVKFDQKYKHTKNGYRAYAVSATLEVRERRFAPYDLPSEVRTFLEDFEAGNLDLYTLDSGSLLFTLGDTTYGQSLFVASQFSGTIAQISRPIPTPAIVGRIFRVKHKLTAINSDDSGVVAFCLGSTQQIYINPCRETSFDPSRQAVIIVSGETHQLGATALALNEWYETTITLAAGVGNSICVIKKLSDNTTSTLNLTGDYTSLTVDNLKIFADKAGLTCPVQFDDIFISE